MTDASTMAGNGETAAVVTLTPEEQLQKSFDDRHFAELLSTRQALRFSIDELKRRPDTLATMQAQLAHVETLIAESGRPDPELVNIEQQAKDAAARAEASALGAAQDKARAEELARKAAEKSGKAPAIGAGG